MSKVVRFRSRPARSHAHVTCVNVISCGRTRRIDADGDAGKISRDAGPVKPQTMEEDGRGIEISCKGSRRVDR